METDEMTTYMYRFTKQIKQKHKSTNKNSLSAYINPCTHPSHTQTHTQSRLQLQSLQLLKIAFYIFTVGSKIPLDSLIFLLLKCLFLCHSYASVTEPDVRSQAGDNLLKL